MGFALTAQARSLHYSCHVKRNVLILVLDNSGYAEATTVLLARWQAENHANIIISGQFN